MTEPETQQWESERYSMKVAGIMILDSDRVVLARQRPEGGYAIFADFDPSLLPPQLLEALKLIAAEPEPAYALPSRRSRDALADLQLDL